MSTDTTLIDENKTDAEAMNLRILADNYYENKEYEKSINVYMKILNEYSHVQHHFLINNQIANCYIFMNQLDKARQHLSIIENEITNDNCGKFSKYNLACSYSLMNEKDTAMQYLMESENKIDFWDHVHQDSELQNLHTVVEFQNLLARHPIKK